MINQQTILNTMINCINDDTCLTVSSVIANELFDLIEDLGLDCDDYRMSRKNGLTTIWKA